jgi:hypothetical protein
LAVPSRVAARLPHLTSHDILEIDGELRAALAQIYKGADSTATGPRGQAQSVRASFIVETGHLPSQTV